MSEHKWSAGIGYKPGCIAYAITPTVLLRTCGVCKVSHQFDLPPGHDPSKFVMGPYSPWDGVSTCEDVLAENERYRIAADEAWKVVRAERAANRPKLESFLADLNSVCAKHCCHLTEQDGELDVIFHVRTYELLDDDVSVVAK